VPAVGDAGFACETSADCASELGHVCLRADGEERGVCGPGDEPEEPDAGVADAGHDAGFDAGPVDGDPCAIDVAADAPFEVCDDRADNDDDGDVDEEGCLYEHIVELTSRSALPAGYAFSLSFDHRGEVRAGRARADGEDVQVWSDASGDWQQLHRVLDPDSAWGLSTTTLWVALPEPVGANDRTENLRLYSGALPPERLVAEGQVFAFADFFERPDGPDVGGDWVTDIGSGALALRRKSLFFDRTDGQQHRPAAAHDFPEQTGRFAFGIGFDWERIGGEARYRVLMQLGDSTAMPTSGDTLNNFTNVGVGPSLVWSGPDDGLGAHQTLACEVVGALTEVGRVSGPTRIEGVVQVQQGRYDLVVDGVRTLDADFSTPLNRVDRLRLSTWEMDDTNTAGRAFRYVWVREEVAQPPLRSARSTTRRCR
jgi:hypothetical protein